MANLPDTDQWVNRTEIKSESSTRIYIVSQHRIKRHWGCSCPGYKSHRRCKHLDALNLPGGEVAHELAAKPEVPRPAARHAHPGPRPLKRSDRRSAGSGFLGGYDTYDPFTEGPGSVTEWREGFQERMGLAEARQVLGITKPGIEWEEVQRACGRSVAASLEAVLGVFKAAADTCAAHTDGSSAEQLMTAKFQAEAFAAYLAKQAATVESEVVRISRELAEKVRATA